MELEQETFNTLKELADIQTSVSTARAELNDLKATTEKYMVVREKEAEERILKVLKQSRDVLEDINTNHNELTGYNQELKAYANELKNIASEIATLFEDFNTRMEEADKDMETHRLATVETLRAVTIQRVNVQEDRKMIERERAEIRDGWRLLKDRQQTLKEGFEELKAKKN